MVDPIGVKVKGLAEVFSELSWIAPPLPCERYIVVLQMLIADCGVSVSVAETVVPAAVTEATFDKLPLAFVETIPVMVNVTLSPGGMLGMMMPLPCINMTVVLAVVGQDALPVALPQVTPVIDRPVMAGSVNTALNAVPTPEVLALLTTTV